MKQSGLRRFETQAVFFVTSLLITTAVRGDEQATWHAQRTWAVIVGVLEWQENSHLHGFPKNSRRDGQFVELLRRRGVPAERIVYLQDRHATRQQILATLEQLLPRTAPGDFLILYYAGHGLRSGNQVYLANYDITTDTAHSGLSVAHVVATIDHKFRGSHVLLTADCCHSGGLADATKKQHSNISYAALTSSQANSTSTGHWTFTECLLGGFSGDPTIDLNADGAVTLDELSRYSEEEMAFAEGQLASFATSQGFSPQLTLATVEQQRRAGAGHRLEAEWKGSWWPARVLEEAGGESKIHYAGFGLEWDEWVGPQRLRPYHPQALAKGTPVEVEWQDKWWPATVRNSRLGIHLIEYTGFGHEWDEWVGPKRIRVSHN